ncbi:MAG: NCS2 family permease [Synergistaceae bacterium]|nr:NCS2 family permease [Synergistaceae bacterium]MBQ4400891.1 NCS2 family permease [Synergistaceae bacterium]MBQ6114388.1 NCS2 family permease [Synergistaceae bacterium]MBQ6417184.1 NCS2 family permease [Synergistaceae bacterium]MBQ6666166.1 NCS2 family permease [Synergistaceae bacterium]
MSLFRIRETGTTFMTEVLAGITTFVTMSYIIFVNPNILSNTGMDFNALVVVTCLASALGTFLMAILADYPIALAPGMGLNAFFAFGVVLNMKINGAPVTWQMALAAVFIEGAIFAVLTLTSIREAIMNSIPKSLKIGISAGIGLFIAFIGLQSAGIVVNNDATLLGLGQLRGNTPMMLSMLGLLIMAVLTAWNVKGALLLGIIIVTGIAAALGLVQVPEKFVSEPPSIMPLVGQLDFSLIKSSEFWVVVFTFFFVDFFDTLGTLVGVCNRSGLLDENGNLPRAKGALMADAIATMAGAAMGTSTVTSYVESSSGVAQGGRTGLTAIVTALLFVGAIFFTPLVGMVPAYATAPALIIVGIYMMMSLRDLNYDDWTELIPSIIGFFMMPLAYSIAVGIEFAIVIYVAIKLLTGKMKDISFLMVALSALFIAKELLA